MGLCLSLESPSFDYIYVNSLRDFLLVNFNNPLDRPPCSEDFCFFSSFVLLFFSSLVFCCLHCTSLSTICQALFQNIFLFFLYFLNILFLLFVFLIQFGLSQLRLSFLCFRLLPQNQLSGILWALFPCCLYRLYRACA